MELVDIHTQSAESLADFVDPPAIEDLRALARELQGLRILHINATSYGGGVSELLRSIVPLLRGLGIVAEWRVIAADPAFFKVTKGIHNALQGGAMELTPEAEETYLASNRQNAAALDSQYDVVFVHDPQPAAIREFARAWSAHWVWRCHLDTSEPNATVWDFLRPYVASYDVNVFTMANFVPPGLDDQRVIIEPPAIDPRSPKNLPLPQALARQIMQWVGVELDRPLLTQVSRFDPWKDPLGVIEVYKRVREEVPDLQLALLGSMALDDPEGWDMYQLIVEQTRKDPGIHVFTNLTGVGNVEVNAFQALSDVVVQKSIREGFGLVVSETLWKGTPVVAGRAGGIPMQIPPASAELLVDDTDECTAAVLRLLRNPHEAREHGAWGRDWVREHFLLPRLVADELRLMRRLVGLGDASGPLPSGGSRD